MRISDWSSACALPICMWVAGITQGLMWREYGADGYLVNSFADTVAALHPMFILRAFGGLLYLLGAVLMVINVWQTIAGRLRDEAPMHSAAYDPNADRPLTGGRAKPAPGTARNDAPELVPAE